jgi:hypothetical protein
VISAAASPGQAVSQRLFGGTSWREDPALAPDMFAAFKVLRQLHEMRWLLGQAEAKAYGPDTAGDAAWRSAAPTFAARA